MNWIQLIEKGINVRQITVKIAILTKCHSIFSRISLINSIHKIGFTVGENQTEQIKTQINSFQLASISAWVLE